MKEAKIISFSGGRSSAMMLRIMQQNGLIDEHTFVVFANTGKEHEATLDFVNECSVRWGVPVYWVEYIAVKPFYQVVDYARASRDGKPFEAILKYRKYKYLPNQQQRLCTQDMKVKTINRFVKHELKYKQHLTYLGIRADEPKRIAKQREHTEMPLVQFGVTKADVKRFWTQQGFDLQIPDGFGNCDLCFMKGRAYTGKLVNLIRQQPERADWWIEMEKRTGAQFIKDISYQQLKNIALGQKEFNFDLNDTELDCFCGG